MKKIIFFALMTLMLSLNAFGTNSNQSDTTDHLTTKEAYNGSACVFPKPMRVDPSERTVNTNKLEEKVHAAEQQASNKSDEWSSSPNNDKPSDSYTGSDSNKPKSDSDNKSRSGSDNNSRSSPDNNPKSDSKSECQSTECNQGNRVQELLEKRKNN